MSFTGQINFGYPITSQNIVTDVPDNAVLPLSIGSSLQGNILGVSFGDLKSNLNLSWGNIAGNIYEQGDLINLFNNKQNTLYSGNNIKTINGNSILGYGNLTVGMPDFIEYNTTDKTVWCNGKGDFATNTTFGEGALKAITFGNQNTAIGYFTLQVNTTGTNNVAVGSQALLNNISGNSNIAVGADALRTNTTGDSNVAIGKDALYANNGGENTAIGRSAMQYNTTGFNNAALGSSALLRNTTGSYSVAVGNASLINATTGSYNTAVGESSLNSTTTGGFNTALGASALYSNTTGTYNTAIGYNGQSGNFSGSVILGANAIATANNQFVVGSTSYNAGAIATETITPNRTWTVRINGANYKIPMVAI